MCRRDKHGKSRFCGAAGITETRLAFDAKTRRRRCHGQYFRKNNDDTLRHDVYLAAEIPDFDIKGFKLHAGGDGKSRGILKEVDEVNLAAGAQFF